MSIFDQARKALSTSTIEQLFSSPGAYWENGEYWTLSPLRSDNKVGSFSISEDGRWWDFADSRGGDIIDLLTEADNCSKKEAAEKIVRASGGIIEETTGKKKKPAPDIPVPPDANTLLNKYVKSDYAVKKYGNPVKGWKYHTSDGGWAFSVVRYEKPDGTKSVIPYYYSEDGKWHQGQAYRTGRPLYRLHEITNTEETPVLVVEGEKCADVDIPGYIVTTWAGGSSAVGKTDWSPLANRDVTIWPDADQPGLKAAAQIKNRLPHAVILNIQGKPKGWDVADAASEGINIEDFINECPVVSGSSSEGQKKNTEGTLPFRALGFSETAHVFLLHGQQVPYSIPKGYFSQSRILELAPLSWWAMQGLTTDQGSIRTPQAQDLLMNESTNAGRFNPKRLRGAGVWRDNGEIIINDGEKIIRGDNTATPYHDYKGSYFYLSSQSKFGTLQCDPATDGEGQQLMELFEVQEFANYAMAVFALGWSLLAPYAGILSWRPHIWITGRRGSGKSFTIERLIHPLCGPFAHQGSGKDTEAGIRRALKTDARPVIIDEGENQSRREIDRIMAIVQLARNASSDASANITQAHGDGTVEYQIRSMFCFASVQIPGMSAAMQSRISRCELKPILDYQNKKLKTESLLRVMDKPERFRKRTFDNLSRIIADIEFIADYLVEKLGDRRHCDQVAPMISACWWVAHSESISTGTGKRWIDLLVRYINLANEDQVEDEDRLIEHLLSAQIMTDDRDFRTVAELLQLSDRLPGEPGKKEAEEALSRAGIRLADYTNGTGEPRRVIAIPTRSDQITRWLKDTPYESGYDAQIRRHPLCLNGGETKIIRTGIGRARCRMLDWDRFVETYMGEKEEQHEERSTSTEEDTNSLF